MMEHCEKYSQFITWVISRLHISLSVTLSHNFDSLWYTPIPKYLSLLLLHELSHCNSEEIDLNKYC